MIQVRRGPPPSYFSSSECERESAKASAFFRKPSRLREQSRFQFANPPAEVMRALYVTFSNKCAYCETALNPDYGNLDRFRPPQNATSGTGVAPDYYWWLAYEWRNLYLCCRPCNQAKGDAFPVGRRRVRMEAPYEALGREHALLLDPCNDDPEAVLLYLNDGRMVSDSRQGMETIDILNLNRRQLMEERRSVLHQVEVRLSAIASLVRGSPDVEHTVGEALRELISPSVSFGGLRRQLLRNWAASQQGRPVPDPAVQSFLIDNPKWRATPNRLEKAEQAMTAYRREEERVVLERIRQDEKLFMKSWRIERIELENIRGIESLVLESAQSSEAGASCLTLLGENGTCKTTILQSVALALMGPRERKRLGLRPRDFLRSDAHSGRIRVWITGSDFPIEVRLYADKRDFESDDQGSKVIVMAYGPTRFLPSRRTKAPKVGFSRVENIFRPKTTLTAPTAWLSDLNEDWFRRTAAALKDLLGFPEGDEILRGPPIRVRAFGGVRSFSTLSAGYQTLLAIVVDIMRSYAAIWGEKRVAGELSAVRGVLIIDEIDAHLHPRWKLRVISDLRRLFPNAQLLLTTHDPLCLRGLDKGEVAVLERDEDDGRVYALSDLPSPKSLRVDQLLTSEFFGLSSTRDPATDAALREYQHLLAVRHRTGDIVPRIAELEQMLDMQNLLGNDARERLLLRAADAYLGRVRHVHQAEARRNANVEIERQLAALWQQLGGGRDDQD